MNEHNRRQNFIGIGGSSKQLVRNARYTQDAPIMPTEEFHFGGHMRGFGADKENPTGIA
jgi:hypothetical protein